MFEILFLIVVAAYFIQASLLSIGSKRKFSKIDEKKLEPATVIVAARNEIIKTHHCRNNISFFFKRKVYN